MHLKTPPPAAKKCMKSREADFAEKCRIVLTSRRYYAIISRLKDLGVAQLVARYLGVVEAASSSLVTQTK